MAFRKSVLAVSVAAILTSPASAASKPEASCSFSIVHMADMNWDGLNGLCMVDGEPYQTSEQIGLTAGAEFYTVYVAPLFVMPHTKARPSKFFVLISRKSKVLGTVAKCSVDLNHTTNTDPSIDCR